MKQKDVVLNKNFYKAYKKFSPGPLTYILKKNFLELKKLHVQI